ncbi:MAG: UDP-3-O-(3-hydroxymyristoyl)glucosamine N-acyltransferase [Planctomycetota bacterium]
MGPFAVVEGGVELGDRVSVAAVSLKNRGSRIGEETMLMPRVVVYPETVIGRRCLIHAGAVLGADGFGFATSAGRHHKVPQLGQVVVEDDVELGANSAIDRGALGETVVGEGSKIDDLVMIAHGVRLGPGCLIAAQSGIAGSTRLGRNVTIAGQSGAAGHLRIGDRVVVAAKSAVFDDVGDDRFVAGVPAVDHLRWKRVQALLNKLPELRRDVRALRERLRQIEGETAQEED